MAACAVLAACTEFAVGDDPSGERPADEALVRLTVSLPQSVPPQSRADAVSDDAEIAEVMVLVFVQDADRYVYRYMTQGERLTSSGDMTRFEVKLTATSDPVKLMLAANYGDAFADYAPLPGNDPATVRAALGCSFAGLTGELPMYGEVSLPSGLQVGDEDIQGIKMLRAVARTDVELSLAADSRPFRIESVRLYRANDKIQIGPDQFAPADAPKVTEPSVFSGAGKLATPIVARPTESTPGSVTELYVSEADGVTDSSARLTGATCLVVGGYYDGQSTLSYYRVDFDPGIDGHPFGQILRNYRYVFRIVKVTAPGWTTADEAAVNRATSLVAEIEAWEDFTTDMFFDGDNYLGVSSRNVAFDYQVGKTGRIDVQATVPYTVQWLDTAGQPVGEAVSGTGATVTSGGFTVTIGRDGQGAETVSWLRFNAVAENRTDKDKTAVLRITADRWTFDITVTQRSPERYRKRIVRVLSVAGVGDYGASTPSTADGLALRRILNNTGNFGPNGTAIVGGFAFTQISHAEIQATGTGSASDHELFRSVQGVLNAQDVIYLTYSTPISNELAQVVLAWLAEKPGRVLIVGTDTDTSSAKLRQYLTSDGTWNYYYRVNIGSAFKRAAQTDSNRRFFTAPFGVVAENAPIVRIDDLAGYCSDYPATVVPLVVSSATGKEKTMIVGVNLQRHIVYHGDSNLNQVGRLSIQANSDGTVTTDFDRLTANLWAWIVETVCENG